MCSPLHFSCFSKHWYRGISVEDSWFRLGDLTVCSIFRLNFVNPPKGPVVFYIVFVWALRDWTDSLTLTDSFTFTDKVHFKKFGLLKQYDWSCLFYPQKVQSKTFLTAWSRNIQPVLFPFPRWWWNGVCPLWPPPRLLHPSFFTVIDYFTCDHTWIWYEVPDSQVSRSAMGILSAEIVLPRWKISLILARSSRTFWISGVLV